MGWLGGLGPCDMARSVNQPFSYASCSIIFHGSIRGNSNPQFYVERYRSLLTRAMLLITYVFSICDVKLGHGQCAEWMTSANLNVVALVTHDHAGTHVPVQYIQAYIQALLVQLEHTHGMRTLSLWISRVKPLV